MYYKILFTETFKKKFHKLDKQTSRIIKSWILKNLIDVDDPRKNGKALTGNLKGVWRYRVGDYRLFARIEDDVFIVFLFDIGHHKEIYN